MLLEAIVLAGGQSSRMGRDKALLPIGGVPLLQRVCSVAQHCASTVYVVTPWPERYQMLPITCRFIQEVPLLTASTSMTPRELSLTSSHPISPSPLPHGPLIGFAQGLAQVQTNWVLLLACDLPRLQTKVLQKWADELENVAEEAIALLPRHAKGWEPLCGFYRRRCLPDLINFIDQGGHSFQHWLTQHAVQILPLPEDNQMLFNCNTPADLNAVAEDLINHIEEV